jgi:hypothetical protein
LNFETLIKVVDNKILLSNGKKKLHKSDNKNLVSIKEKSDIFGVL